MSTIFANNFKNTSGEILVNNQEVKTDKITGKTTAGSIAVQGEGTNTTNLQQGLSKAWLFNEPDNSNLIRDSFNVSSFRDNATGQHGITLTTAMGNDDWTCQVTGTGGGTSSGFASLDSGIWGGSGDMPYRTTTQVNCRTTNQSGDYNDHNDLNFLCHGDLA